MRALSSKFLAIAVAAAMLMTGFMVISSPAKASPDEWGVDWLDGFQCRKLHEIGPSAGAGTDYNVGIKVYNGTGTDGTETVAGIEFGKVYANLSTWDLGEIRFTASDGLTILPFWKENYTANVSANFWVRISADLDTVLTTIYVYWGNHLAIDGSCGEATFQFYDHFSNQYWKKDGIVIPYPNSDWHYTEPTIIYEDGRRILTSGVGPVFKLWYRAQYWTGGTYNAWIRYCESEDGMTWTSPVVCLTADPDPSGNHMALPFVCHIGAYYYLYAHGHLLNTMDCYRSSNGMTGWALIKVNAISNGAGAWDNYILGNVFVWKEGATWYCIYESDNHVSPNLWLCGLQTSADGLTWAIYGTVALIGTPSCSFGGPHLEKIGTTYYVWGQESRDSNVHWEISMWYSTDLHTWTRSAGYEPVIPRELPTEALGMVDPTMVFAKGNIYLYYTGWTDAFTWNGLQCARSGIPFDQLVQTQENQVYNKTLKWEGTLWCMNITSSVAIINGATAMWRSMESIQSDFSPGVMFRANGNFHASPSGASQASRMYLGDCHYPLVSGVDNNQVALCYGGTVNHFSTWAAGGSGASAETNIDGNSGAWDIYWSPSSLIARERGVEKMGSPLTTEIPTNNNMSVIFDAMDTSMSFTIDSTFVRPYIASEPAHGGWSDLCVYTYTGGGPGPTPGPTGNYGDMAWIFIFLAMGAIFLGFIVKKSEELK